MSSDLLVGIRDYAERLDASAPSAIDLMPSELRTTASEEPITADAFGSSVAPTVQPMRNRLLAAAAVAAVIVLVFLIGSLRNDDSPVITEPTTTPTTAPAETSGLGLRIDPDGSVIGTGFAPNAEIVLTAGPPGASTVTIVSDADGSFSLSAQEASLAVRDGRQVTATDGDRVIQVTMAYLSFLLLDPESDVAAGEAAVPDGGTVVLEIGDLTVDGVVMDGRWQIDLSGSFDVQAGDEATVVLPLSEEAVLVARHFAGLEPVIGASATGDIVDGIHLRPNSEVVLVVDGEESARIMTDSLGAFSVGPAELGIDLRRGQTLEIVADRSTSTLVIPFITFDVLDLERAIASGTAQLPNGTDLNVWVWTRVTPDGPEATRTYDTTVIDGEWSVALVGLPDAPGGATATVVIGLPDGHNVWTDYQP